MKRYAILRLATVVGVALLTETFAIAQLIAAPPPTNLRVGNILPGKDGTSAATRVLGSFVVQWDPATINATPFTTYLLASNPKGCEFVKTTPSGQFRQASFTAPPYQVKIQCACKKSYVVSIATVSAVAGGQNSAWTKAPAALIPCK